MNALTEVIARTLDAHQANKGFCSCGVEYAVSSTPARLRRVMHREHVAEAVVAALGIGPVACEHPGGGPDGLCAACDGRVAVRRVRVLDGDRGI